MAAIGKTLERLAVNDAVAVGSRELTVALNFIRTYRTVENITVSFLVSSFRIL